MMTMIERALVIAWKELVQLRRDRMTLAMMLVLPVVQLLLFGYAINTDVRHIPTLMFDQDHSPASRELAHKMEATGHYDFQGSVESYDEIDRALRSGTARVALVVPPRYSSDLVRGHATQVQLIVDGSDPQIVGSATSTATLLVAVHGGQVRVARLARMGAAAGAPLDPNSALVSDIELRPAIRYNPDQRTAVYVVPGIIGVILTMTMVMLTAMALARERERGTLEQLIVSPIRRIELIVGKILPYVGIGYVQMTLILTLGYLVFDVPIVGSLPLLFALAFLFIAANLALGLFFSTLAKTQQQAMQMSFFFLLPNILLSGFMFPFEAMPAPARALAQGLPLTHFLRIVRGVVLKGSTFRDLSVEVMWLLGILVALVSLSSLRFRKKLV